MRANQTKAKIQAGKAAYGFHTAFPSADLVEFCGHLGFEWCWLDAEHSPLGLEFAVNLVRACETAGIVPMVRVSANDPAHILGYLEIGMMGVIVPHVNTVEDAKRVVDAVRYAPAGRRGAASQRAANYGLTQSPVEYYAQANREIVVTPLIEEHEGFENLPKILEVEGVDAIGLGPADLAMSLGLPGQRDHPKVQALVKRAEDQVVASGKALDMVVTGVEDARQAVARGGRLISIGIHTLLRQVGRGFLEGVRA